MLGLRTAGEQSQCIIFFFFSEWELRVRNIILRLLKVVSIFQSGKKQLIRSRFGSWRKFSSRRVLEPELGASKRSIFVEIIFGAETRILIQVELEQRYCSRVRPFWMILEFQLGGVSKYPCILIK